MPRCLFFFIETMSANFNFYINNKKREKKTYNFGFNSKNIAAETDVIISKIKSSMIIN